MFCPTISALVSQFFVQLWCRCPFPPHLPCVRPSKKMRCVQITLTLNKSDSSHNGLQMRQTSFSTSAAAALVTIIKIIECWWSLCSIRRNRILDVYRYRCRGWTISARLWCINRLSIELPGSNALNLICCVDSHIHNHQSSWLRNYCTTTCIAKTIQLLYTQPVR